MPEVQEKAPSEDGSVVKIEKVKIESLEQFLELSFTDPRKKQKAPSRLRTELSDDAKQRFFSLGVQDTELIAIKNILKSSLRLEKKAKEEVRNFTRKVLKAHPIMQNYRVQRLLEQPADIREPARAVAAMGMELVEKPEPLSEKTSDKTIKKPDIRLTAYECLALWLGLGEGLSDEELTGFLYEGYWKHKKNIFKDGSLYEATEGKHARGVYKTYALLIASVEQANDASNAARRKSGELQETLQAVNAELEIARSQLEQNNTRIAELESELTREAASNKNAQIHLKNEKEQQRTRVLRRLNDDVRMLNDALVALRRTPPVINVMDDHADRVISSLRQEILKLENE